MFIKSRALKTRNKVELIGYVGKDPVARALPSGTTKVMLRLATHSRIKNENGEYEWVSTWHDIVAWKDMAEYALQTFIKGSHILVNGMLSYRTFIDRNGKTRYITEIIAYSLTDLDR